MIPGTGEGGRDAETDGGPRKGPDRNETIDLIENPERLIGRLRDAPPALTHDLAQGLGRAMRRAAEDAALWDELERAGSRSADVPQVVYLALVDWEALLEGWGLPDVERTPLELIDGVDRGVSEQPEWGHIRELLHGLGSEISEEAGELAREGHEVSA